MSFENGWFIEKNPQWPGTFLFLSFHHLRGYGTVNFTDVIRPFRLISLYFSLFSPWYRSPLLLIILLLTSSLGSAMALEVDQVLHDEKSDYQVSPISRLASHHIFPSNN